MEINLCFGCMAPKSQPGPCPVCGFDENTYEPSAHHLPPGIILAGKYLVGRVLGEGGFGITYIAWDLNLELKVAIKEYYPNGYVTRDHSHSHTLTMLTGFSTDFFQRGLEKFVDEARRLGKFWGLPGIVAVKDYFQENHTAYIVMEFAEGRTLKAILQNTPFGRLPADQVLSMMEPVMDSLEIVHRSGLIHRDISPDNLMVDADGRVKLIDFGAARDFMAQGERSLSVMLKPGYAPEEQYRSRGVQGPWTDVYALCATIYRAITGIVPEESLDRMAEDVLERPSQMGIPIEPFQEEALMKGLAIFQRDRYQSIGELKGAMYGSKTSGGPGRTEQHSPPENERARENTAQSSTAPNTMAQNNTEQSVITQNASAQNNTGQSDTTQNAPEQTGAAGNEDNGSKKKKKVIRFVLGGVGGVAVLVCAIFVIWYVIATRNVSWADPNMERLMRMALGKSEDEKITRSELENIEVIRFNGNEVYMSYSADYDSGRLEEGADIGMSYRVASLEDLRYFPNLVILQMSGVYAGDGRGDSQHPEGSLEALAKLENLQYLDLSRNHIEDVSLLSELRLSGLNLYDNDITDASDLWKMDTLEDLDLGMNPLSHIDGISDLGPLESLNLHGTNISDMSELSRMESLLSLDIGSTQISDFSPLLEMTQLQGLGLSDMNLGDVSGLGELTGLTKLDLSENYVEDLSFLAGLTELESLDLYDNSFTDISVLSELTNLKILDISLNDVADISPVYSLSQLEDLDISSLDLTTDMGLGSLSELKRLDISFNDLTELEDISGLTGLEKLDISWNEIENMAALSGLTDLTELNIAVNPVSDITFLEDLTSLENLDIHSTAVTDISSVEGLDRLTQFSGASLEITDISPLKALEELKSLDLWSCGLTDISDLTGLDALEELDLSGNAISDLDGIDRLTRLFYLDLDENQMTDISVLSGMDTLTHLNLSQNPLDLSGGFDSFDLPNLESLYLSETGISGISGLADMIYLRELYLYDNEISDISVLENMTDLEYLDLSGNQISSIRVLSGMDKMVSLYIDNNAITDLSPLSGMTCLTDLYFAYNDVSDLTPLRELTSLTDIDCSYNAISDLSPLSGLYQLEDLDISGNGITDISALEGISGLEITNEEE